MAVMIEGSSQDTDLRRERMRTPDEVSAMLRLHDAGWGYRRIAAELGCSRHTVQRYVQAQGWTAYKRPERVGVLAGHETWLAERFRQHRGNADVVRQELLREHGVWASLRTVERSVSHLRQELHAQAIATVRFETPPGKQLQIDFGELRVTVGDETCKVYLFVATLGYSRRIYVQAFRHERQTAWFDGLEGAFRHFGGVAEEVLLDNARALVLQHDAVTREVVFNERLHAFSRYWGFRPRACAPYRARTKGKDERGVGYVKRNAIAGRRFGSWAELETHLVRWTREIADLRVHGTTGEVPLERFGREEARALRPRGDRPSFRQTRELTRRVQSDSCVEVDTNHYSVPWRLIGVLASVLVSDGVVQVSVAGEEVARHDQRRGRRERAILPGHLVGIVGYGAGRPERGVSTVSTSPVLPAELLRPLAEYEVVAGGSW